MFSDKTISVFVASVIISGLIIFSCNSKDNSDCDNGENYEKVMAPLEYQIKWIYSNYPYRIVSAVLGKDGTIYAGCSDFVSIAGGLGTKIFSLLPDGQNIWEFTTSGQLDFMAIGSDGTIFDSNWAATLYALNKCGEEKWKYIENEHPPINMSDALFPSNLYLSLGSNGTVFLTVFNKLLAFNKDGSEKWEFVPDNSDKLIFGSNPAVTKKGEIYVLFTDINYLIDQSSVHSTIYAIKPDGSMKWSIVLGDKFLGGTYFLSHLSIGLNEDLYLASITGLYSISPDGQINWKFDFPAEININNSASSSIVIAEDGTIYLAAGDYYQNPYLYAINSDGSKKWEFEIGPIRFSSPVISSDGLIYMALGAKIYSFNPDGGINNVFDLPYSNSGDRLLIGCDGTLYLSFYDSGDYYKQSLIAVQSPSPGPALSGWPMFGHDPQNTGNQATPICP